MLASFDDLIGIGAIPDGTAPLSATGKRAERLLAMASGLVCAYLGTTEAALVLTYEQTNGLAAIVAEIAGSRLNVSAAPSSDPYAYGGGPAALMLTKWHRLSIDNLNIAGIGRAGSRSFAVTHDPDSSFMTGLAGWPYGVYGFDTIPVP